MSARRHLPLLLAALAVLGARLLVVAALGDHPLLQPADGLDTGAYVALARKIAGGDVLLRSVPAPFFVSPLYAWFLGAVLAATGGSLHAVLWVQALLGAAAAWLAGDAARRLLDDRAAVPAAVFLGLTGVVAFHEALLLQAALDPFLTALALWLLVRALEGAPRTRAFLLAGLALGVLSLNRPNVLPWAALVVALLVFARGFRAGTRPAAAFLLGAALGVLPAAARNLAVSGEPVLVSSHGGLNLLVGNGPGASGVYRWLDGITPDIAGQAADAKRVAEAEAGRTLSAREVSAHFAAKAWEWIAANPGAAARLFARKCWYVLSGDEAPLNFSFPWYRREAGVLKLLFVGPGLLVPLGGAGLVLLLLGSGRLPRRDALVWASFAPAYVLLVAAFFVATRYRLPLYVPLATAGGGGLVLLLDALRARDVRRLALAGSVALPLAAVSLWPTGLDDGSSEEETQWILVRVERGDVAEAVRRAESLAKSHPQPGVLWFRLGQAEAQAGRLDDAADALRRSLGIDAGQVETERVLAAVLERRGMERAAARDLAGAAADLEEVARLDRANATVRLNLAAVLAERGDLDRARVLASEALALKPGYGKAEALLRALGPERTGPPPRGR
ncbi:MAG: glycosyltransferase family 39 protein [Thermoanaerobaculia bacterium]